MDDLPLAGRRVFLRVDMNVSAKDDNKLDSSEDYRIRAALPTITELQQQRCKVMVVTHQGRPQQQGKQADLEPIRQRLSQGLQESVRAIKQLSGAGVRAIVDSLEPGAVVLLPNIRGDEREEACSLGFAKELADLADVYINEAFSVSHRNHASVALLPKLLPSCAGRRTVEEVRVLDALCEEPQRPFVAVASGAKIETKIGLLASLSKQVDTLCVGGRIANIILAAMKLCPSNGFTADELAQTQELLAQIDIDKLLLPEDVVIGGSAGKNSQVVAISDLQPDVGGIWDIGPKTTANFLERCRLAKTVLWNGPLGKVEEVAYAQATNEFANGLSELNNYRVVGGGDTVNVLERLRVTAKFNHVSVGGGALLAYLEGSAMPGLMPLYI